jgi:multidrug efflux pump subunit AcrB
VISVDINTEQMLAKGVTPSEVVDAVNAQNLILPGGTAKIGELEQPVELNGSYKQIDAINGLPVRTTNGATVLLGDVAQVRDGSVPQTNVARQDGRRGVLMSILKGGNTSTVQVVQGIKDALPAAAAALPKDLIITPLFDQSLFVKASIDGVIREAIIAACLTAAMILLFLGNWRSTIIIAISIPLSILTSILVLYALGETINIMTLGGMALAVGILVDDATVTIENIERHLHMGSDLEKAILEGAGEIALPALVSTLCICIVFVPMFFLTGVARYLFVPLAEAVVFAMLASYVLSRTLVPTLAKLLMKTPSHEEGRPNVFVRFYRAFDRGFEALRRNYVALLSTLLTHRLRFIVPFLGFCVASLALIPLLGQDFFPDVDGGQIRLHMRMPTGTRIEETARAADGVEAAIREIIPKEELGVVLDNLGVPNSSMNLSYSNGGTMGTLDGEILISLKEDHGSTAAHVAKLRAELPTRFPGIEFFFHPADIVTQILNFGLPAAIDIQFIGADLEGNNRLAGQLAKKIRGVAGAVDVHVHQRLDMPTIGLEMDRVRLQQMGISALQVAQNALVSLAGSFQTAPAFWLNPVNGIVYNIVVQSPQYRIDSMDALLRTPVHGSDATKPPELLGNLVQVKPRRTMAVVSHSDVQPVIDIYASVQGRDLGGVAKEIESLVDAVKPSLARGNKLQIRGQVRTMQSSFIGLGIGLAMAVVLVYLLIVVNFQSWLDPFIIITALPAALAGIAWMLFLTDTTLSVPALTGAIMTMGVATANSILVIAFARQRMSAGAPPLSAALEAGAARIRPVLMTALAMIIGMIPMSLGLGEGGEQNAPLGRAVIGGLLLATISTLYFVPVVFASIHQARAKRQKRRAEGSARGVAPSEGP